MTKLYNTFKKFCFCEYVSGAKDYNLWYSARKITVSENLIIFINLDHWKKEKNLDSCADKNKYLIIEVTQ